MDPHVTLATLKANDLAEAVLERLQGAPARSVGSGAASLALTPQGL